MHFALLGITVQQIEEIMSFTHSVKNVCFVALLAGIGFGCAHSRDVRAGADGVHRVVVRQSTETDAERSAISQAEHYCKQSDKRPVVVEDKGTTYKGEMDENTRKTINRASQAATVLGHGMGRAGEGPGPVGTAGRAGMIMTSGDDYVAEMRFSCQ